MDKFREYPQELSDEDRELLEIIFEPSEREIRVGRAVPSAELIAQYQKEIAEGEAARLRAEHSGDDKLIAA